MPSTDSPKRDRLAADVVLEFLEDKGLSPEAFSRAAFNANCGYVSGKTIRRVVEDAHVPELRARGVIARYMQRAPRSIWRNASVVAGRKVARARMAA